MSRLLLGLNRKKHTRRQYDSNNNDDNQEEFYASNCNNYNNYGNNSKYINSRAEAKAHPASMSTSTSSIFNFSNHRHRRGHLKLNSNININKNNLSSSFTTVSTMASSSSDNSTISTARSTVSAPVTFSESMRAEYIADHQQVIDQIPLCPKLCGEFKSELIRQRVNTTMGVQFALWRFAQETIVKREEEDALHDDVLEENNSCFPQQEVDNSEHSDTSYGSFVMSLLKNTAIVKNLASSSPGPDLKNAAKFNSSNSLVFAPEAATSLSSSSPSLSSPFPRSNPNNINAQLHSNKQNPSAVAAAPSCRRRWSIFTAGVPLEASSHRSALTAALIASSTPSAASLYDTTASTSTSTNNISNTRRFKLKRRKSAPNIGTNYTGHKRNESFPLFATTTSANSNLCSDDIIKSASNSNRLNLFTALGIMDGRRHVRAEPPSFERQESLPGRRLSSASESENPFAVFDLQDPSHSPSNKNLNSKKSSSLLVSVGTPCSSATSVPIPNNRVSPKYDNYNDDDDDANNIKNTRHCTIDNNYNYKFADDVYIDIIPRESLDYVIQTTVRTFSSDNENDSGVKEGNDGHISNSNGYNYYSDNVDSHRRRRCRRHLFLSSSADENKSSLTTSIKSELTSSMTTSAEHSLGELIVDWGEAGLNDSDDDEDCGEYENEDNYDYIDDHSFYSCHGEDDGNDDEEGSIIFLSSSTNENESSLRTTIKSELTSIVTTSTELSLGGLIVDWGGLHDSDDDEDYGEYENEENFYCKDDHSFYSCDGDDDGSDDQVDMIIFGD